MYWIRFPCPICSQPKLAQRNRPLASPGNVIGLDWSTEVKPLGRALPPPAARPTPITPPTPAPKPAPKPSPDPASPAGTVPSSEAAAALQHHNQLRARHGSPPLRWDATLGRAAVAAAATCSTTNSRPARSAENMARGFTTFTAAVDAWYATISSYDLSHPGPQASAPKAALFANIVWRTTTGVGCAVNRGCTRPFYVCIYLPSASERLFQVSTGCFVAGMQM
jgi:hypothetical protein